MPIFSKTKPERRNSTIADWYEEREAKLKPIIDRLSIEAETMKPEVMLQQPARLAKFQEEHDADVQGYEFRCERWGDYLALFIQRGSETESKYWVPEKRRICAALNIGETREIKLIDGRLPDLEGHACFGYFEQRDNTTGKDEYCPEPLLLKNEIRWMKLSLDNRTKEEGMHLASERDSLPVRLEGVARPAEDDLIRFEGIGATLHMPCGLGKEVYQKILDAIKNGCLAGVSV